jgi:hypothetical protein
VAGDAGNPLSPTYASFNKVGTFFGNENNRPNSSKSLIKARIDKNGNVSDFTPPEQQIIGGYDEVTHHNIADIFVKFGDQSGLIWNGSNYTQDKLFFGNPTYVLGRPLTEPYWTRAVVAGTAKDVLVQLFERRVLTYTPSNPAGFKVEMGNVGQHYFQWRYRQNGGPLAEDDWWLPDWVQPNANSGFYQYPGGASRVPGTAAELVDIRWKDVNPQDGVYDWSIIKNALQNYSGGIWLRWRLTDNVHLPTWLRQKYPDIGLMRYPDSVPYDDAYPDDSVKSPGDFVEVWREGYNIEFRKLMDSFRQQGFAANPKIKFSYFPGGWKWSEFDLNFAPQMAARGLTPDGYMAWFKHHVEDWIAGFGEDYKYKLVFTGVDEQQNAWGNQQWSQAIGRQMNEYTIKRGLGARDGLTEMFNYALTDVPDWGTRKITLGDGNYMVTDDAAPLLSDPKLIFATENECFIGCGYNVTEDNYYQAMKLGNLKALQLRMNWINTSEEREDVLRYTDFFNYVSLSLGKQVSDSPDAWVALREGYDQLDTNKWWVRNFERWLVQREVAPNGKTVRTQPFDMGGDNGTSYEARRTDHATGNDYIYFDVNDAFIKGGSHRVQVKVTFLDNFSGNWGLEYDAADGNPTKRVTATAAGDGKWKTVTFELPDAAFQNRQISNMDFRLFNDGQHDLTASFVRVIKLDKPN